MKNLHCGCPGLEERKLWFGSEFRVGEKTERCPRTVQLLSEFQSRYRTCCSSGIRQRRYFPLPVREEWQVGQISQYSRFWTRLPIFAAHHEFFRVAPAQWLTRKNGRFSVSPRYSLPIPESHLTLARGFVLWIWIYSFSLSLPLFCLQIEMRTRAAGQSSFGSRRRSRISGLMKLLSPSKKE